METSPFRLIDHGWIAEFEAAGKLKANDLLVMSPFIKNRAVKGLIEGKMNIRALTRFSLRDFLEGVSDLSALRLLLEAGSEVRGIMNLHAKLYIFGDARAILTSANLTDAALTRNHEIGFVTDDPIIIQSCRKYFDELWDAAKQPTLLTHELIDQWEEIIRPLADRKHGPYPGLPDFGANLRFVPAPAVAADEPDISTPAFVKFLGKADDRADLSDAISDQIVSSEANWAVSYSNGRRPRKPKTGDIMFFGRLVHSPNDIKVFGRAVAYEHQPGRDDATPEDIMRCGWRKQWPHYIRVREPEFIDGTLKNGISLHQLMDELASESFAVTAENAHSGHGNQNPRKAIMQKPHMLLSVEAAKCLNARFYEAIKKSGHVPLTELKNLHWPELPSL